MTAIRDRIEYLPSVDRPKITWPEGARVAVWVSPNIEHYEYLPPPSAFRTPWPRVPQPDVQGYAERDYGNRVGLWRMTEVLDAHDICCTVSLNLAVLDHFPEINKAIVERNWAVMSHGVYNTRYLYGMSAVEERAFYRDTAAALRHHTGLELHGMLGPAITANYETPDLMAEAGLFYSTDWYHDDRPVPLKVRAGKLCSIPYTLDLNDIGFFARGGSAAGFVKMCTDQFDVLYEEGAQSGVVMCIALHPYVTGQPHLVGALDDLLVFESKRSGLVDHWRRDRGALSRARLRGRCRLCAEGWHPGLEVVVAIRRVGLDQGWYEVSSLPTRASHPVWPDGAALALSAIISLSYYEDEPPEGSIRPFDLTGGAGLPPVKPQYAVLSCREYGLRVGFFRLAAALEAAGVTPAVALDVMVAEEYPFLVEYCIEHGYELIGHGIAATQPITSAMDPATEEAYLADTLRRFEYATGQTPRGWFGPSWSESTRTPGLLKAFGLSYLCDWPNDEQPFVMTGAASGLVSLPLMFEYDDNYSLMVRNQSVTQYADGLLRGAMRLVAEGQSAPRFLGLSFNSWISGQGWRVRAIASAVKSILAMPGVIAARPGDVAAWVPAMSQ